MESQLEVGFFYLCLFQNENIFGKAEKGLRENFQLKKREMKSLAKGFFTITYLHQTHTRTRTHTRTHAHTHTRTHALSP